MPSPKLHTYEVPAMLLLVKVTVSGTEQEVSGVRLNEAVGGGLTVTVILTSLVQPFPVIVYAYVTTIGFEVVFTSISLGLVVCGVVMAALLIPVTAARVQVNVAPTTGLVGV